MYYARAQWTLQMTNHGDDPQAAADLESGEPCVSSLEHLAEVLLGKTEAYRAEAFDCVPAVLWFSGEDAAAPRFNRAWGEFTGQARDAAADWIQRVHPDDAGRCLAIRRSANGGPFEVEYRVRRADGEYRWVVDRGEPKRNARGVLEGYVGAVTDITERRAAEDQLRKVMRAMEQSPAVIVITNLAGNIEYVNPRFTEISGYTAAEAIGQNPRILKSGETPPEAYRRLWESIQTGEWRGEFHNRKKNGELYWESATICPIRDASGRPTHYIAVKEDITERKRVEQALRDSEQRFRIAAANATDCIFDLDPESGRIDVLRPDDDLYGAHSRDEWAATIHPDDRHRVMETLSRNLRDGESFQQEYRTIALDGQTRHLIARALPLPDGGGAAKRWLGVLTDVTGRRRVEQLERDRVETLQLVTQNRPLEDVLRKILSTIATRYPQIEPRIVLAGVDGPEVFGAERGEERRGGVSLPIIGATGELLGSLEALRRDRRAATENELRFLSGKTQLIRVAVEHHRMTDRLAYQAGHDPLTDAANQRALQQRLGEAIERAEADGLMVGLLFVDLDRFKTVNDTMGHAAGDRLLIEAARRMERELRPSDMLARVGGDEFTALLPGLTEEQEAWDVGQRLLEAMRQPFTLDGDEVFLTASVGVSFYPQYAESAGELQRSADQAMYAAKRNGKDQCRGFSRPMGRAAQEDGRIEADLHHALERQELRLHYQPLFDLRSGDLIGVEALLRWVSPKWGAVPPDRFIRLAEESGVILPISDWVIEEACAQSARWRMDGYGPIQVAVNVSALQFSRPDFAYSIATALEKHRLQGWSLEVEVTEGMLMREIDDTARQLGLLRALGVSVAIDDFGTGYSSLGYLHRLPINTLKIDKCFIRGLMAPSGAKPLVEAIIRMAHSLKMTTTAEGIESQDELETLRRLGCDKAQGFLLGRPAPPEQLTSILENHASPAVRALDGAAVAWPRPKMGSMGLRLVGPQAPEDS
jgi:diguanylate cyclase (GGDEF)-like protein/PAS domain S-box-containing protein